MQDRALLTTRKLKTDGKGILYHHSLALINANQRHYISLPILHDICLARRAVLQFCCTSEHLLDECVARFGPLLATPIALGKLYRSGWVRGAVDGLPIGNRYRSAELRKNVTFSQFSATYTWTLSSAAGPGGSGGGHPLPCLCRSTWRPTAGTSRRCGSLFAS